MTSNIVVTKIPVIRKGQMSFFQVNIPKDAASVTGIQTGMVGMNGTLQLTDKTLAGTVKLQALHQADLCFCSDIFIGTSPLERTLPGWSNHPLAGFFAFPQTPYTHSNIARARINNCYTLYGCYQDALGKKLDRDIAYTIGLYLWTELANGKNAGYDAGTGQ